MSEMGAEYNKEGRSGGLAASHQVPACRLSRMGLGILRAWIGATPTASMSTKNVTKDAVNAEMKSPDMGGALASRAQCVQYLFHRRMQSGLATAHM